MPDDVIFNSDPDIEKLILPPSASVAVTVPIAVWFSGTLKTLDDVNTGALPNPLIIVIPPSSWPPGLVLVP